MMRKKLLFVAVTGLVCLWSVSLAEALTLTQLIQRTRVLIRDSSTDSTRQRFSDSQLTAFLNDAQRDVQNYGWFVTARTSFTLSYGTTEYALPSNFMTALRVMLDDRIIPEWTFAQLDQISPNVNPTQILGADWNSSKGRPQHYYIYYTTTPILGVHPVPNSTIATSTGVIKVDYVVDLNDMSATSDKPFNGFNALQNYGYILVYYAVGRAWQAEGNYDWATPYFTEYSDRLKLMNERFKTRPTYGGGFIGGQVIK